MTTSIRKPFAFILLAVLTCVLLAVALTCALLPKVACADDGTSLHAASTPLTVQSAKKKAITIKTAGFKLKLPKSWTGKVKVRKTKTAKWVGVLDKCKLTEVCTKNGKFTILYIYWGKKSTFHPEAGLVGDLPDLGAKTGAKYRVMVHHQSYLLFPGSKSGLSNKGANTVASLITGGKAKRTSSNFYQTYDSYLKKAIKNKMTVK